jgi:hypothetical protein
MIPRRGVLGSAVLAALGIVAGNATADPSPATAAGGQPSPERSNELVADAIAQLRKELQAQRQFTEIDAIREAQKQYLRANAKLPDFIEVGADIWFAVHDWHVRWQQPLTMGRDALGRYTILLVATAVIMRTDSAANFLGQPYDNK